MLTGHGPVLRARIMSETQGGTAARRWVVSPWFDLAFLINAWWIVLALLPLTRGAAASQETSLDLWQIYFVITPHRWITLILVATDPDRREGRRGWFMGLAIITAVFVGIAYGLDYLRCVVLVDFIWNAWHFASQHGGVLRIYGRMGGGGRPILERWGFRIFVTYTNLRAAGWATGWTEISPRARMVMHTLDALVIVPPTMLLVLELIQRPWERLGKTLYLTSVFSLYLGLLWAIGSGDPERAIIMASAASAFHSVEYLAVVSYYAMRRRSTGSERGMFRQMARNWLRILAVYMLVLGIVSRQLDQTWHREFLAINLWAAFLHYAYDGMIWKLRRPGTAQSLNVELPDAGKSGLAARPT